ncbi:hypothetical protein QL285_003624 [Trifolium repens]|nr:hypothetical protein QL285_003624 [Trifolium repens]
MQAEPATALGLIQVGPLSNGTTVEPGAAHTYSAAVIWKKLIALLCGVDVGQPLGRTCDCFLSDTGWCFAERYSGLA